MTPFEASATDRMTLDPDLVTCVPPAEIINSHTTEEVA